MSTGRKPMSDTLADSPSRRAMPVARYAPALVWIAVLALGAAAQTAVNDRLTAKQIAAMALTTVTQLVASMLFFRFLNDTRRRRLSALTIAAAITLVAPFLIPSSARPLRFVTACASLLLVMKMWDLHVHASTGQPVRWSQFLPFLLSPFSIVLRKHGEERRPSRETVIADFVRHLTGSLLGLGAIATLYLIRWRQYPFLVEHGVKALVIFAAAVSWIGMMVAVVRLSGGVIRDYADAPLLARTPADFWRRYNRVIQQYFHENVFKRAGGRRSPVTVTLFIFMLSALIHEYVFGIAIGRVQGFQTVFFMLQGVGVVLTLRVRPRGRVAVLTGIVATLTFNLLSSIFFFLSFHAVVPLYANPLPAWLQR